MADRGGPSVAHVTSVHPALDTRIFHRECRSLAEAGYDVVLLAPHPRDEVVDGVQIRALRVPAGRLARALAPRLILRAALRERASVYHLHDPELLPVGLALKLAGRRVVYDAHEDVPRDVMTKHWLAPGLRHLLAAGAAAVEWAAGRAVDGVVGATPSITERFPAAKSVTVQNFPPLDEFGADGGGTSRAPHAARAPLVAYVGGITEVRGALEMLEALQRLPAELGARLVMAGQFATPAVEGRLRAHPGWAGVEYLGWQDRAGVAALLGRARAGLVVLHPTRAYRESYPVKMFEYMAAGLPVIASDFPLWRRIVEEAGAGMLVDPRDPAAIAAAVQWVLEHPDDAEAMGRRGRAAVLERYNWRREREKLLGLYRRVAGGD